MSDSRLLEVRGLKKYFPIEQGLLRRVVGHVRAVDHVSLSINKGRTLGLVGESGSGKTTLGRCVLRAIDSTAGEILFHHEGKTTDLAQLRRRDLREFRKHMQMIFQDPYSSLDPRKTVFDIVSEPLRINKIASGKALEDRVRTALERVGLNVRYMKRYPHAFSGGQRQRIGIARALSINPQLIVCDEAVSALDVSVQAQILNLLKDLQEEFHLTYLFIAHDLSVVEHVSDEVAVMYVGKLVEQAPTQRLFARPRHPYTEALLSAIRGRIPINLCRKQAESKANCRIRQIHHAAVIFIRAALMRKQFAGNKNRRWWRWRRIISPPVTLPMNWC